MTRLTVALDARALQDRPLGGVGRSTQAIVTALRDEVDMVLLTDGRRPPLDIELPQWALRAPVSATKAAWLQLAVPQALRGFEGIFHCPWYGLPFRQPVPMVVTIHDLTFLHGRTGFTLRRLIAYRVQARWAARSAAHVLTVSEAVRAELCTRYALDPQRVSVHPNLLDPALACPDASAVERLRHRLGIEGRFVVALAGAERRRIDLVLGAWPAVRTAAPDTVLVVIGGPVAEPPEGTIAVGVVDDDEWAAALAGADALVYPTEYEGFGYPALEAMALGTPVICAPVGGLPEVVGNAARWLDRREPEAIAAATTEVLADAALAERLVARGRQRAAEASDPSTLRDRVLEAYEHAAVSR